MSTNPFRKDLSLSNLIYYFKVKLWSVVKERICKMIREETGSPQVWRVKKFHNYIVLYYLRFRYVIFYNTGHVNCSGNRNFDDIHRSLWLFNQHFFSSNEEKKIARGDCVVVNSTWNGKFTHDKLDLNFMHQLTYDSVWTTSFRPDVFPAIIFRHAKLPTCVVFKSGAINVLGAKNELEARTAGLQVGTFFVKCLCQSGSMQPFEEISPAARKWRLRLLQLRASAH